MGMYDEKIDAKNWEDIDEKIELILHVDSEEIENDTLDAYLLCTDHNSNKFVVKAHEDLYGNGDWSDTDWWELDDSSKEYENIFKNSALKGWMPVEKYKIPACLFICYCGLDEDMCKDLFEELYENCAGERCSSYDYLKDVPCSVIFSYATEKDMNKEIEHFIDSEQYLNYDNIFIASSGITHNLAEKIDHLNYEGFRLFDNKLPNKWLLSYSWCRIYNKSKLEIMLLIGQEKGLWCIEDVSDIDYIISDIVTERYKYMDENSVTLRTIKELYEKWGSYKFLNWIRLFYYDGCENDLRFDPFSGDSINSFYDRFLDEILEYPEVREVYKQCLGEDVDETYGGKLSYRHKKRITLS